MIQVLRFTDRYAVINVMFVGCKKHMSTNFWYTSTKSNPNYSWQIWILLTSKPLLYQNLATPLWFIVLSTPKIWCTNIVRRQTFAMSQSCSTTILLLFRTIMKQRRNRRNSLEHRRHFAANFLKINPPKVHGSNLSGDNKQQKSSYSGTRIWKH